MTQETEKSEEVKEAEKAEEAKETQEAEDTEKEQDAKEAEETREKSLDRMTAKDLRKIASGMSEITGAHGMNKADLLAAIKKARGIVEDEIEKPGTSPKEIKKKIKELKAKKIEALGNKDSLKAKIFRRRISRLKKKMRRAA